MLDWPKWTILTHLDSEFINGGHKLIQPDGYEKPNRVSVYCQFL